MNVMSASIESILDNVRLCNILICQQSTQSKAQEKSFTSVTVFLPSNLDKLCGSHTKLFKDGRPFGVLLPTNLMALLVYKCVWFGPLQWSMPM